MTTRPFTFLLAAALAGMVATGVPLAALILNSWLGWPPVGWWLGLWLFSAVPVFAGVSWRLMVADNALAVQQRQADIRRDQLKNARVEWELKSAKREQATASGLAGAREAEARERAWEIGLEILFRAIDKAGGASARKLAGCVGSDTHPALMAFYTSPAGLCILRDAGGNVGHTWGFNESGELWGLDEVLALLRAGALPHPDGDVPKIEPLPDSAAQRRAPRKGATVEMQGKKG